MRSNLLGAVCRLNSNGPEMTVDAVSLSGVRVVWFSNGAFCEASVGPRSITLREPTRPTGMTDATWHTISEAHRAALSTLAELCLERA